MKKFYVFFFVCICSFNISHSQLLSEDFDYTADDLLTDHGWNLTGTSTANPIVVTSPGLTFNDYIGSGIGNAAGVNNTGQDLNKLFGAVTSGSVYASFLVNATATSSGGDYFFHFYDPTLSTAFRARTFIIPDPGNPAKMVVGLSFNASSPQSTMTSSLDFGKTYLFVLKYEIVDEALNDKVSLYVFEEGDNFTTEPIIPTLGPLTGTATDITPTGIAIRQFDAAQRITVDGFRVNTIWELTNSSTGIKETYNENTSFYPNLVTDGIIHFKDVNSLKKIEIYNLSGQCALKLNGVKENMNVSDLKKGTYIISVTSGDQVSSSKLVIK
ncbi:conserved exported hypothetical protein [uncultured Paludibacter sp.]|nr:conserved exported hypothetical protein [uncultured Paludibacter sp.]